NKPAKDVDGRDQEADSPGAAKEGKGKDLVQPERNPTTELQGADDLLEDLGNKDKEIRSRETSLGAAKADLAAWESDLAKKDEVLRQGTVSLDRMRQDIETRMAEAVRDREAAAKIREESVAMKAEADRMKAQS